MICRFLSTLQLGFGTKSSKLVMIVRSDLQMGKGKTAAQCAHSAILCYKNSHPDKLKAWLSCGQPKIVVKSNSLEEIETIQKQAKSQGICAEIVRDAGHTQLPSGTVTVLGLGPDKVEDIDKLVGHLKLL